MASPRNDLLFALAAILSVIIFFILYYLLTGRKTINRILTGLLPESTSAESINFISDKITGIIFSGILPALFLIIMPGLNASDAGLTTGDMNSIKLILPVIIILVMILTFFSSRNAGVQNSAPELKVKTWNLHHIILSCTAWLVYLFGYELFFRGILWFTCFNAFGFWWALLINIILYALVHIPKGRLMTYGAIPFGILLCCLTWLTGSFIPAFLVHSAMAISTELFSVYHNPELRFKRQVSSR